MSASAPWSVKGIDAKARSVAKELARRSGMTLGEWLNQMILEGRDVSAELAAGLDAVHEPVSTSRRAPADTATRPLEDEEFAPAPRPSVRIASLAARQSDRRLTGSRAEREALPQSAPAAQPDIGHVTRAIETLGSRLETSETRSAQAVRGVSQAVEALLGRLERSEERVAEQERVITDQVEEVLTSVERLSRTEEDTALAIADRLSKSERRIAAHDERVEGLAGLVREDRVRFERLEAALEEVKSPEAFAAVEGALGSLANQLYEDKARAQASISDVRQDMVSISHRLAQIELRDPQKDAQALIDQVVARMAQRLESAEARTQASIRGLEQAFSGLDARLIKAERGSGAAGSTQSLAKLAGDLSLRMDEARAEMLGAVERATQAKQASPAGIERHLNAIAAQVAAVEKRSARALEQMGQDVLRIAENLNRRVVGVEQKSEALGERLSGEIDHLAARTEGRLETSTTTHANALERLGGEIARISERLNARIADAEKRSHLMVGGLEERVELGKASLNEDIAERIRASEDRTQKLLEDARAKIDARLGQASLASLQAQTREAPSPSPSSGLPNPFSSFIDTLSTEAKAAVATDSAARAVPELTRRDRLSASLAEQLDEPDEVNPRGLSQKPFSAFPAGFDEGASASVSQTPAPSPIFSKGLNPDPFDAPRPGQARISPASRESDVDITGRLLSGLTDFVAETPEPELPAVRSGAVKDGFGESPADPFASLRAADVADDGLEVDFDAEFDAAPDATAGAADPFADTDDVFVDEDADDVPQKQAISDADLEDDPFADIDLARKTAPRATSTADKAAGDTAFDDIFDRDLEVPSPVSETPSFHTAPTGIDPMNETRARASTRDALMSARAAVQASIDGTGDSRKTSGVNFGGKPKSGVARSGTPGKSGGSLLSRLIKTSSVSVLAVTALIGGGLAIQALFKPSAGSHIPGAAPGPIIPGGSEEGVPYAAVLTEPDALKSGMSSQDRVSDLYQRAEMAVKAHDPSAVAKLQSVASLGHATAQFQLGLIYDGKTKGYNDVNKKLARDWYGKAADSGSVDAMYNLAMMYYAGEGGRMDYAQSANLFRRAADRGFRDAQYNLASLYLQGKGVGESTVEAYKWFMIASNDGDTDAAQRVREISGRLTDAQRTLAESEATRFKPMSESPVIVAQN
jgi:localization factor PodJL